MNLQEQITRMKQVMGIYEQFPEDLPTSQVANSFNSELPMDQDKSDFSNSQVQDIVWRAGGLKLNPKRGGLWFAENKEDVEKFTKSMGGEQKEVLPYLINLQNPRKLASFWNDYLKIVGYKHENAREDYMNQLLKSGYDGIIIDTDTWNDTGDENAVTSKQYIVFDPKNVKPA